MYRFLALILTLAVALPLQAQHGHEHVGGRTIQFPDTADYLSLTCDLHIHTVFSDGSVWPTNRVDEAWNEGLDVIAITDHIERNPGKTDVGGDDNSSYKIALPRAKQKNIILVKAGEITRSMPPGHFNALFLEDTQALDKQDWHEAFEEAKKQGAYIIWNHPGWKAQQPDTTLWWDEHTELYNKGMIHAIEVFNEKEWYPIAVDWCMEKDLAPHAASDVHGVTSEVFNLAKYHRPMTLVLATERSEEALREALFANRTIAYFANNLVGKTEYLKAFFEASVKTEFHSKNKNGKVYIFKNSSDVPFTINVKRGTSFTIPATGEVMVTLSDKASMEFIVKNLYTQGTENLKVLMEL